MGCGKSSVGRKLSELLSCPFIDLDEYIEQRQERSIPEIFATDGEAAFRALELDSLKEILSARNVNKPVIPHLMRALHKEMLHCHPERNEVKSKDLNNENTTLILSLGGGTLTTPECARLVKERTTCIYLHATTDTLVHRLENENENRPMLSSPTTLRARIEELMQKRSAIYEGTAHHIIDINGKTISEITAAISHLLQGIL